MFKYPLNVKNYNDTIFDIAVQASLDNVDSKLLIG